MIKKIKSKIYNILRWSQKYTETDMVYLAKGGSWLTLGQTVSTVASFLSAIAFANLLPRETYGTYKYILSIVSILAIPTLSGINAALSRAIARGYEGSFIPALKTKIRWGLLGGLASLGLAGYYYINGNITLTISFLVAAVFLPFMDSLNIYGSFFEGKKLFDVSTKFMIFTRIVSVGAMISILFLTNNIFLIFITYFASNTLLRFIVLKITLRKFKLNKKQDTQTISYGKHLSLMELMGTVATHIDKILLWHFFGAIQLAIYSFAITPVNHFQKALKATYALAFPKLANQDKKIIKKTLLPKILKFSAILIIPVALYIFLAPYIYKLVFPQYLESIKYSQYYILVLLLFPKRLLGQSLTAHAKKKSLYIVNIANIFLKITLLLILLPLYGIWGAIVALILPSLLTTPLEFYLFKKM